MANFRLVATTLYGLESVLAKEIDELGGKQIKVLNRAVSYEGDLELLYKSNIWLRTALRILFPISTFRFSSQDEFYKLVKNVKWDDYMKYSDDLVVYSVVNSTIFSHSKYVALRTKDAIVDFFRNQYGQRPSVNTKFPDLTIHVHISGNECNLSLDSSGDPLFMRGYRSGRHDAPLNEALAAGMVLLSGWDKKSPFVDPMCGSGTLGIEAAMIGYNIPPGIIRDRYGFKNWYNYDDRLFRRLMKEVPELKEGPEIICSDINPAFSRMAKSSLKRLGLGNVAKCFTKDFERLASLDQKGTIMMNPPYGERLETDDIEALYGMIGSRLKHEWMGYNAWVLTNNKEAMKSIGLKSSEKVTLLNGQLECRFMNFSLYEGSNKTKKADL